MGAPPTPSYDLDRIKYLLRVRQFDLTIEAERKAEALGLCEDDIYDCVKNLKPSELFKTMKAEDPKYKGLMQDVYYTKVGGKRLYVKLQMFGDDFFRVVSFKENEK